MPQKGSGHKVRRAENKKRVMEMATQGFSYDEMAAELGYRSKSSVHALFHQALKETPAEAREAYQRHEDQRIEALMSVYMPAAMSGDIEAAKFVDTLIGRRAGLVGLNAPKRAPVDENNNPVDPSGVKVIVEHVHVTKQIA